MENNNNDNIRLLSEAEFSNDRFRGKLLKVTMVLLILLGVALLLSFFKFKPPIVPSLISVDFSVLPELIASIAYGPIAGAVVCLLKFVVRTAIVSDTFYSNVSNFFIETTFIVFSQIFYEAYVSDRSNKGIEIKKSKAFMFGSFWGIIPATVVMFFVQRFYLFPKLDWNYRKVGVTTKSIIASYAESVEAIRAHLPAAIAGIIPKVTEIWHGILLINVPITIAKYIIVILVAAPLYSLLYPVLHFKTK